MNWIKITAFAMPLVMTAMTPAFAQDSPKATVKFITPFSPSEPKHTVGRVLGQKLPENWGQAVIIDYELEAGTLIGADFVTRSPVRGLTIDMEFWVRDKPKAVQEASVRHAE